ncbi:hypothetical protein MYCO108962_23545 [Mycobacterium colombiense]
MYSGSHALSRSRTSPILVLVRGSLAWLLRLWAPAGGR